MGAATSDMQQLGAGPVVIQLKGDPSQAYRRLVVWQKADELAYQVYRVTKEFPDDERFGLISQMRRASVSVAANIVEGYTHLTKKERRRFYEIARSSLTELEYYIDFTYLRLEYMNQERYQLLSALRQDVGRLLNGFMVSER